jgi:hypothetical protein
VEENGGEEKQAGQNTHSPMLGVRPKWMFLFELQGDDVGDGGKNEDPRRMEVYGDSENFADA